MFPTSGTKRDTDSVHRTSIFNYLGFVRAVLQDQTKKIHHVQHLVPHSSQQHASEKPHKQEVKLLPLAHNTVCSQHLVLKGMLPLYLEVPLLTVMAQKTSLNVHLVKHVISKKSSQPDTPRKTHKLGMEAAAIFHSLPPQHTAVKFGGSSYSFKQLWISLASPMDSPPPPLKAI